MSSVAPALGPRFDDKPRRSRRSERLFYCGMAAATTVTVIAGFSRTYYLKTLFGTPPLTLLLHLHGVIFSAWIALFIVQTCLVAADRVRWHRRLGIAGAVVAALVVAVGTFTAITSAAEGRSPIGAPLEFLVIPLGDMLVFAILVAAGLWYRHRSAVHKRLMLLSIIAMLSAATARLPFGIMAAGPPAFFGLADLFLVPCVVYDLISRRRVHSATLFGSVLIVASQPLRLMVAKTPWWNDVATWMISLVG